MVVLRQNKKHFLFRAKDQVFYFFNDVAGLCVRRCLLTLQFRTFENFFRTTENFSL